MEKLESFKGACAVVSEETPEQERKKRSIRHFDRFLRRKAGANFLLFVTGDVDGQRELGLLAAPRGVAHEINANGVNAIGVDWRRPLIAFDRTNEQGVMVVRWQNVKIITRIAAFEFHAQSLPGFPPHSVIDELIAFKRVAYAETRLSGFEAHGAGRWSFGWRAPRAHAEQRGQYQAYATFHVCSFCLSV